MNTLQDKKNDTPSESQRAELNSLINLACEPISYFWPMKTFIHHNPLHGLEHFDFEKAINEAARFLRGSGYLPNNQYRKYFREGRVTEESIKEALETAPRLESGLASSVAGANNQGAVAIGATKIEIDRIAQLISLAQQTADDVVEDAIVAAREQIADLLADVLVASSSELAATGAIARKAELESELLELDARISARRNDADQLAELIETRRRALGEIARDLSGRPDGPPDQHPATSTIEGVAVIDESTTAAPDQGATQRPAREIRSGDDIEDPFFSALQRREPLEGE